MAKGGGRRGEGAARARVPPPTPAPARQSRRVAGPAEGACLAGTRARARTSRAPRRSPPASCGGALRLGGWLAGWRRRREGTRSAGVRPPACLPPPQRVSVPSGGIGERARVGRPGAHCQSGCCLPLKRPAIALELSSTPVLASLIEVRGPAHWAQKPRGASAPFYS